MKLIIIRDNPVWYQFLRSGGGEVMTVNSQAKKLTLFALSYWATDDPLLSLLIIPSTFQGKQCVFILRKFKRNGQIYQGPPYHHLIELAIDEMCMAIYCKF